MLPAAAVARLPDVGCAHFESDYLSAAPHPLGATGARIVGKASSLLGRFEGTYALAAQCIGGGQGIATVLERV